MRKKEWKNFIVKAKKEYQLIGSILCPALNNENVYFNKHGFHHLIMKNGIRRPKGDQIRRLKLVSKAPLILLSSKTVFKYRETIIKGKRAYFCSFEEKQSDKIIIVVVRQIERGVKHFFSVMDKNIP